MFNINWLFLQMSLSSRKVRFSVARLYRRSLWWNEIFRFGLMHRVSASRTVSDWERCDLCNTHTLHYALKTVQCSPECHHTSAVVPISPDLQPSNTFVSHETSKKHISHQNQKKKNHILHIFRIKVTNSISLYIYIYIYIYIIYIYRYIYDIYI